VRSSLSPPQFRAAKPIGTKYHNIVGSINIQKVNIACQDRALAKGFDMKKKPVPPDSIRSLLIEVLHGGDILKMAASGSYS